MANWYDNFTGGSQRQGTATAESAGSGQRDGGIYGILYGISGLAGDVATTVNSLQKKGGTGAASTTTPTIAPVKTGPNYLLYGGLGLGVLAILFLFFRKKK